MSARVQPSWRCAVCEEYGDGPDADKQAERHTKAAQHTTLTFIRPKEDLR